MGNSCLGESRSKKAFSTFIKSSYIGEGFLDVTKLDLPEDVYTGLQDHLLEHWGKIPKAEKTLIYLMRKGMPDRLFPKVLQILFPVSNTYNIESKTYLSLPLPNFTPTFTSNCTIESQVSKTYLTEEGITSLKSIMWLLNYKYLNINYTPFLCNFVSIILIFQSESRSFEIVDLLLSQSCEKREILDKHFTTEAGQFKTLVGMSCAVLFNEVEGLQSLIKAKKIDFAGAISDILKSFYIGYFKIGFLQRFLSMFLADGCSAILLVLIGVFKTISDCLSEFKADFSHELKSYCFNLDEDDSIFSAANRAKIPKLTLSKLDIPDLQGLTVHKYSRPNINFTSKILSIFEIESIWSHIPDYQKHNDLQLLYSTTNSGYSLKNLLRTCSSFKTKASVIVLKSISQEIIGGYFESGVETCTSYIGNNNSFIFTVKPLPVFYSSTGANDLYLFISESLILFGGGNGSALSIDHELLNGTSSNCETFGSPVLISSHFEIVEVEVLGLI